MDYSEEIFFMEKANEEHKAVLDKSNEILNYALEIIMPEDKRTKETVSKAIETSVQNFCNESYSMGYNDCLLDILKQKEEANAPIVFPSLKS